MLRRLRKFSPSESYTAPSHFAHFLLVPPARKSVRSTCFSAYPLLGQPSEWALQILHHHCDDLTTPPAQGSGGAQR